ncbi:MAG TPA: hypothetical protein VGE52_05470 [Pirellulales bacterium]
MTTTPAFDAAETPLLNDEIARLAAYLGGFELAAGRRRTSRESLHAALVDVLLDQEWGEWSNRRIAAALRLAVGVECSPNLVGESRARLELEGRLPAGSARVGLDGRWSAKPKRNDPLDDAIDSTLREIVARVNEASDAPPRVVIAVERMVAAWVQWRNAHVAKPV